VGATGADGLGQGADVALHRTHQDDQDIAELADGPQVTVRTKLLTKSNTEVPVDYRMLKEGERWRVYDVVIEGVSLVSSYRSQFTRIIQSGYSELVKKLRTKQDELAPEKTASRPKKQS